MAATCGGDSVLRSRTYSTKSTRENGGSSEAGPSKQTSSTVGNGSAATSHNKDDHDHDHEHEENEEPHKHSHSIFSTHSHSLEDGHSEKVEGVVKAMSGLGDRGSRITLLGLVVNVGLTVTKGTAGWFMNSAALLAEAGHSASDLLGDFVTLFCWRFSRQAPTAAYPYGFGKFETLGTTTVALLLVGGALGIGFHSLALLAHHLADTAAALPPGAAQEILTSVTNAAQSATSGWGVLGHVHSHGHGHEHAHGALDPNAAWFAAASVLVKEYLYRVTRRVADAERSGVLLANAIHHRSDAYSSAVALSAILGTWWFPALPLDPLGGCIVSAVILQQGISLLRGSFGELTDASVSPKTLRSLKRALKPLLETHGISPPDIDPDSIPSSSPLLAITSLRAMRSGALMFVDVSVRVPANASIRDATKLQSEIQQTLLKARREISEVRVKFVHDSESETEATHDGNNTQHEHSHTHEKETVEGKHEHQHPHSHSHPH